MEVCLLTQCQSSGLDVADAQNRVKKRPSLHMDVSFLYPAASMNQRTLRQYQRMWMMAPDWQKRRDHKQPLSPWVFCQPAQPLDANATLGEISFTILSQKGHHQNRRPDLMTRDLWDYREWKKCTRMPVLCSPAVARELQPLGYQQPLVRQAGSSSAAPGSQFATTWEV